MAGELRGERWAIWTHRLHGLESCSPTINAPAAYITQLELVDTHLKRLRKAMDTEQLASIFEAVKVLPLRPEDVIVVRLQGHLTDDSCARLRGSLTNVFGHDRKVLVLTEGIDIDIVRPEAAITQQEADRLRAEWERKHSAPPSWRFWSRD